MLYISIGGLKVAEDDVRSDERMQILCAESGRVSCILTGNGKHFRGHTDLPVITYTDIFPEKR